MLATICSWSHISGISKNGKAYDCYVLHCACPRDTIKNKNCSISGYPVQFRDVSIPIDKWTKITGLTDAPNGDIEDFLTDHIHEDVELYYNITTFNGVDRAFISKVDFGGVK